MGRSQASSKPLDSPEILRRFRAGEHSALEAVYRAYLAEIEQIGRHGFFVPASGVRILGVPERADLADFVQEVFSKAFERSARESFDGARGYAPYITTIARNALIDRARHGGREVPLPPRILETLSGSDGAEAGALTADREGSPADSAAARVVRRYLDALPPPLRAVYHQRYELGLFQTEAAANLGLSRQSLRTAEKKLRKGLERALKREGVKADAPHGVPPPSPATAREGVVIAKIASDGAEI